MHFAADKLRDVRQHRISVRAALHHNETRLSFATAKAQRLFSLIIDRNRVCHHIGLPILQHFNRLRHTLGHFNLQFETVAGCKISNQIVFITHGLHLVLKIRRRAVQRDCRDHASRLKDRQVRCQLRFFLLTVTSGHQQQRCKESQTGLVHSHYSFLVAYIIKDTRVHIIYEPKAMRAIRHDPRSKPQKSPAKMGHHLHLSAEGYAEMFAIRLADSDHHAIRRTPRSVESSAMQCYSRPSFAEYIKSKECYLVALMKQLSRRNVS